MKIIGIAGNNYIAEIHHEELEKVVDKYYGKLPKLTTGIETDLLSVGYNFRGDIQSACRQMTDAVKQFEKAQKTLMSFALMVSAHGEQNAD